MDEMQILIRESFNRYGLQRYICEYKNDVFMESLVKTGTIYPVWTRHNTRMMRVRMHHEHQETDYGIGIHIHTRGHECHCTGLIFHYLSLL